LQGVLAGRFGRAGFEATFYRGHFRRAFWQGVLGGRVSRPLSIKDTFARRFSRAGFEATFYKGHFCRAFWQVVLARQLI
jgi:hypothetical protein